MSRQSRLAELRSLIAVTVVSVVVLAVLVRLYVPFPEKDVLFWSRLYLAQAHIEAIEIAAEAFHSQRDTYPANLADLVGANLIMKIADDPWGNSYHYEVEHGADGERIRIWTIPDRTTQERIGISELTNRTDWRQILRPSH